MKYNKIPEFNKLYSNNNIKLSYDENEIEPVARILSSLGYLYLDSNYCLNFAKTCIDISFYDYLEDKQIITDIGILHTWKLFFKNLSLVKDQNVKIDNIKANIFKTILLEQELIINEFPYVSDGLKTLSLLNYKDNLFWEICKAYYFFIKETEDNDDIEVKFYNKYNVTFEEYISIVYIISGKFYRDKNQSIELGGMLGEESFEFSKHYIKNDKKTVENILNLLSFDIRDAQSKIDLSINNALNFSFFQNKPLLKLNDVYVPILKKYVDDQLFNSLIYKIADAFGDVNTKERSLFWNKIGYKFERYVSFILSQTQKEIKKNKFRIISEFDFTFRHNSQKSSDIYIVDGNNICVIELKSARPLYDIFQYDNSTSLNSSINKLIFDPLKQAIKCTEKLIELEEKSEFTQNKNYYFLTITLKNFPFNQDEMEYFSFDSTIKNIKFLKSISIEEFELLCEVLSGDRYNIFQVLNEYYANARRDSFKNFLNHYKVNKEHKIISDLVSEIQEKIDFAYKKYFDL